MMTLQSRIELATRHVAMGREIVARQRELAVKGKMGSASRELLELFERTQDIFENDLARLVAERKK